MRKRVGIFVKQSPNLHFDMLLAELQNVQKIHRTDRTVYTEDEVITVFHVNNLESLYSIKGLEFSEVYFHTAGFSYEEKCIIKSRVRQ